MLGFVDRGSYSTLTCFPGKELKNNYSLNTVDLCPVGALTSTDFRFKMRVWFLKESPSICTESSAGCNIMVSSREGEIYRITPRRNDDVNDSWMTDSGRSLFKRVRSDDRLAVPSINQEKSTIENSVNAAVASLKNKKVAIVGSCNASLEELYLLNRLSKAIKAKKYIRGHFGEDDGIFFLPTVLPIYGEHLASGFISSYPKDNLDKLSSDLEKGVIEAILVLNEDLLESGIAAESLLGVPVVYLGTHANSTTNLAEVIIPTLTSFEKKGTFINRSFLAQGFEQSVPGLPGLLPDVHILNKILDELDDENKVSSDFSLIWKNLSSPPNSSFQGYDL